MALFQVGEEMNHRVGDAQCAECPEDYPEPCRCGGLMHAAAGEIGADPEEIVLVTRCDSCGRSEDQLDEI